MPLPEMSPLQFLIVHLLFAGPQTGAELRRKLTAAGVNISPPSFSRLMERMEHAAYLQTHCEYLPAGVRLVRPRRFEVTDLGLAIWTRVQAFYASATPPPPDLVPIATEQGELADHPPKIRRAILCRRARRQIKRILDKSLRARDGY